MNYSTQPPQTQDLLTTALEAEAAGISVLPPRQDGTKQPMGDEWALWQRQRATPEDLRRLYANGLTGIGFVCGAISGNLEALDFDDMEIYEAFVVAAEATGLGDLVRRIEDGYKEKTPKGVHWLTRCATIAGNTKLARRPGPPDEDGNPSVKTLLETRGERGYIVAAPSNGKVHPEGKAWRMVSGSVATIATITPEERDALHQLARTFDEMPKPKTGEVVRLSSSEGRPGDDYNQRATWGEVLEPHGWRLVYRRGETDCWRRPGKNRGISATTNHSNSDLLYVFSSSTVFDTERGYSRFSAYALLNHNGDFAAAAKSLANAGYGSPTPPPGATDADMVATTPSGYHLTDLGNCERLVDLFGETIRFVSGWGWMVNTGKRWERDETGTIYRLAAKVSPMSILAEAARITDGDPASKKQRHELVDWARKSESAQKIKAMVFLAESHERVVAKASDFDTDPWLLNVLNGTVDLHTGELRPHSGGDLISRLAPVKYDPNATLPLWDETLDIATGSDQELKDFLQKAAGYSLTGNTGEEKLFFLHGPEAAVKSTFIEALKAAQGDYATTADFEAFLRRRDTGTPRPDIARLAGARTVISIEVDEGKRIAEGLVKMLTGGDTVTARELYARAFEFVPRFKLWLCANHAPKVADDDGAMWRRILRVPFEHTIPKGKRDPTVKARLRDPKIGGPAVLAWAVKGCIAWQHQGLGVPPVVEKATEDYRASMDPLADFISDCCVLTPKAWTKAADLRKVYDEWCKERAEPYPVRGKSFGERLRSHACTPEIVQHIRGWRGIGIFTDDAAPECRAESSEDRKKHENSVKSIANFGSHMELTESAARFRSSDTFRANEDDLLQLAEAFGWPEIEIIPGMVRGGEALRSYIESANADGLTMVLKALKAMKGCEG